jgi:hypothetical protein
MRRNGCNLLRMSLLDRRQWDGEFFSSKTSLRREIHSAQEVLKARVGAQEHYGETA